MAAGSTSGMQALAAAGNGSAPPEPGVPQPASPPFSQLASTPSKLTPLVSVAEETELSEMSKHGSGGAGEADAALGAAALQVTHSGSGTSQPSVPVGPAPPASGSTAPQSLRGRLAGLRQRAAYVWWGLPTACKATLVMAGEQGCSVGTGRLLFTGVQPTLGRAWDEHSCVVACSAARPAPPASPPSCSPHSFHLVPSLSLPQSSTLCSGWCMRGSACRCPTKMRRSTLRSP